MAHIIVKAVCGLSQHAHQRVSDRVVGDVEGHALEGITLNILKIFSSLDVSTQYSLQLLFVDAMTFPDSSMCVDFD